MSDREVDDDFWGATIRENGVGANALVDGVRRRARSEEESFIFYLRIVVCMYLEFVLSDCNHFH